MTEQKITRIVQAELETALRPFDPAVRAAILATPSKGEHAYHDDGPGLRAKVAGCVQTWAGTDGPVVNAAIEVNASLMPSGEKSLPLYLDGEKAPWRHPVYGNREVWVAQSAHPFFGPATATLPAEVRSAMERAERQIARDLGG